MTDLDQTEAGAAARLGFWPGDDSLIEAARELCDGSSSVVMASETGFGYKDAPCEVLDLGAPAPDLEGIIRAAIINVPLLIQSYPSTGDHILCINSPLSMSDPWLQVILTGDEQSIHEEQSHDSPPACAPAVIRAEILEADALLSRHATRLAPSFITEAGSIEIIVHSPLSWAGDPERLHVEFHENDGSKRALPDLEPGTARWIVAALRLAVADLGVLVTTWSDTISSLNANLPQLSAPGPS